MNIKKKNKYPSQIDNKSCQCCAKMVYLRALKLGIPIQDPSILPAPVVTTATTGDNQLRNEERKKKEMKKERKRQGKSQKRE